ncbi:unnamed protein product, partial [Allacma fusca]
MQLKLATATGSKKGGYLCMPSFGRTTDEKRIH